MLQARFVLQPKIKMEVKHFSAHFLGRHKFYLENMESKSELEPIFGSDPKYIELKLLIVFQYKLLILQIHQLLPFDIAYPIIEKINRYWAEHQG